MIQVSQKDLLLAAKVLVYACISTNAESMKLEQIGFRDKEKVYGDYLITVKKLKPKK